MALPAITEGPWIPEDTFGVRLAIVRTRLGWNLDEAARACGTSGKQWKRWETGDQLPRDLHAVARRVSDATGCNFEWLMLGGQLVRSRWDSGPALRLIPGGLTESSGQGVLPLFLERQ